ncbi:MAG: N-acetyltransferase family protein [Solirubrobacteraceae bacterium]
MPLGPATSITVRRARHEDLDRLIALAIAEGEDRELTHRRFHADSQTEVRELFLATPDGQLAGYGRTCRFERETGAPANVAPNGYHLSGILVASSWRRRGIGEELTWTRLVWVLERAAEAWHFTNARHRASLALHAKLGFAEVTRDFTYPGVSFDSGLGLLSRAKR